MQCKDCKWLDMGQKTSVGYLCTNTRRKMNNVFGRRRFAYLGVPTSRLKTPTQPACKTGFEPKGETMIEKTCVNCKREDKTETEFPCSRCLHNATDLFEFKETIWIPCSERLPKYGQRVLACVDLKVARDEKKQIIVADYYREDCWKDGKVIAWMPTPEPYKGE